MKAIKDKQEKRFLQITSVLSFLIGILYICKGFQEQFSTGTYVVISATFLYIPIVWIFRRPGFTVFNIVYSVFLIFLIAFNQTYLYNNYTGLITVFIVMMVLPKFKIQSVVIYFVAASIAFALNEENLIHFFIHIARSAWLLHIINHLLETKYERRKLVLFDDERKILEVLSKNNLQKSIELDGFSESTIYRRIKAAMSRNNMTKKQLVEEFIKEQNEK